MVSVKIFTKDGVGYMGFDASEPKQPKSVGSSKRKTAAKKELNIDFTPKSLVDNLTNLENLFV